MMQFIEEFKSLQTIETMSFKAKVLELGEYLKLKWFT